jgi:hypothetical protein
MVSSTTQTDRQSTGTLEGGDCDTVLPKLSKERNLPDRAISFVEEGSKTYTVAL